MRSLRACRRSSGGLAHGHSVLPIAAVEGAKLQPAGEARVLEGAQTTVGTCSRPTASSQLARGALQVYTYDSYEWVQGSPPHCDEVSLVGSVLSPPAGAQSAYLKCTCSGEAPVEGWGGLAATPHACAAGRRGVGTVRDRCVPERDHCSLHTRARDH